MIHILLCTQSTKQLLLFLPLRHVRAVRQSAKKGTYLAAVIDGYYFPAHGVCLKRAADVPALDSVHLKFSVWVHFLRQTNAAWLPASSSRPRLSAYLAQKIVSSPLCPSPPRVYLEVTWESVCLPGEGGRQPGEKGNAFGFYLFYFYFFKWAGWGANKNWILLSKKKISWVSWKSFFL